MEAHHGSGLWRLRRGDRTVGEHAFVVVAHNGAAQPRNPTPPARLLPPADRRSQAGRPAAALHPPPAVDSLTMNII